MWYPNDHMLGLQRNGVNHAGMETPFDFKTGGPIAGQNYPVTHSDVISWYATFGVHSVRLLFQWEGVQSTTGAAIPLEHPKTSTGLYAGYCQNLLTLIDGLISAGIYVILAMYQSNPGTDHSTDLVYRGKAFTPQQFGDFWGTFAKQLNAALVSKVPTQPSRIMKLGFDLINEPHTPLAGEVGTTLDNWMACAQAAINRIRGENCKNTIFVAGMDWASASAFTLNGSDAKWAQLVDPEKNLAVTAHCYNGIYKPQGDPIGSGSDKPANVLPEACKELVKWARAAGVKVNIGEIALDVGNPTGCGNLALATSQWQQWARFCRENDDVLIGWNWWASTDTVAWGWAEEGSCNDDLTWAFAKNRTEPTVYAQLVESSLKVAELYLRDNPGDTGAEPNGTTSLGFESPDIWVRPTTDGGLEDAAIVGGSSSVVYVRVRNRGQGPYAGDGNDVVSLYWAKAGAGLGLPRPWNGEVMGPPKQGEWIGSANIGAFASQEHAPIPIPWPDTPDPTHYPGGDDHFCLLAVITKSQPESVLRKCNFDGFEEHQLHKTVLKLNTVGWHNIHIGKTGAMIFPGTLKLGEVVLENPTDRSMRVLLAFEILDAVARPVSPASGRLLIAPEAAAVEKLRRLEANRPSLEELGGGTFVVLDPKAGLPLLDLQPGEQLRFVLSYIPDQAAKGWAVRAIQYSREGAVRKVVGGQTFVAGEVEGFTCPRHQAHRGWIWLWAAAALLAMLLLAVLLGG